MAHHIINAREWEPFEIGAFIMALLAYPEQRDADKRERVRRAQAKVYLRGAIELAPEREREFRRRYPAYLDRNLRVSLEKLTARLGRAMQLGAVVLATLKETATGQPLILPEGITRPSLNPMIGYLLPQGANESEHSYFERLRTFERRVWRAHFNIAHVAAAYQAGIRLSGNPHVCLDNIAAHRAAMDIAGTYRDLMHSIPQLRKQTPKLDTIEWIE